VNKSDHTFVERLFAYLSIIIVFALHHMFCHVFICILC